MEIEDDEDPEFINGKALFEVVREWAADFWGERCDTFEADCACCKAWAGFDALFFGIDK